MNRKITLIIASLIFIARANATILLVNNNVGGPGQFNDIGSAINTASPGDTIYISGSQIAYAVATIDKSLTLIGPGTFSQKDMQFPASVGTITIAAGVVNVTIKGLNFDTPAGVNINIGANASSIFISENYFVYACCGNPLINLYSGHDIIIENNVFNTGIRLFDANGTSCYNLMFRNNIIHAGQNALAGLNVLNAVIEHNTFISNTPGTPIFSATNNAVFANNIFYNLDPTVGCTSCLFNNNISYNTTGPAFNLLGGTNLDNIDPQFVNAGLNFNINNNYNVQTVGPAHNAGSDGTDLGYYGGPATINKSPYGEVLNIPVVRKMMIQNTTVPQNGNVDVKVRSTKSRTN